MSSYQYDFAKIKAEHSIESVAARLGLKLKPHGAAFRCQCPSGEGDERGMAITPAKNAWYSFPAQKGGDVLSLVSFVRGCSPKEAAAYIVGNQATSPEKSTRGDKPSEGFKPLDYLETDHEAVVALGIEPEDAKRIGCGFAPRGIMKGKVAWPVRLPDGTLIGYLGVTDVQLPSSWKF
jgi:hypothetical protein